MARDMKFNQVNIRLISQSTERNNEIQGDSFSFNPAQKESFPLSCPELANIDHNLDFILSHFQAPIFPRNIMTKSLGQQKEVFNKKEVLGQFTISNCEDCRINAYPSFTKYGDINRTAPSFIIIDLDLKDYNYSKDKLDRSLNRVLKKIEAVMRGHPTVLWTGNGYHIYQPVEGFILEETDVFARFIEQNGKDLTSKFMKFAGGYLTNNKADPQHNPTISSCLVRVPGTINSKCGRIVKVVQRWDGQRPAIQYLLRDFRRWLIDEKIEECKQLKCRKARPYAQSINSTKTIWWIEKLLQTPIDDSRKFAVWRILIPYLINIRRLVSDEANNIIRSWLDKCNSLRRLDFNPNHIIRPNISRVKRGGYLPISLEKLKTENTYLYKMINEQ